MSLCADVKDLTKKWQNLRTVYLRQRKKKIPLKSGSAINEQEHGYSTDDESHTSNLVDKMCFLEQYVTIKRSTSNLVSQTIII